VNVVVPSAAAPFGSLLIGIGAVLLFACVGLLAMVLRRPRTLAQVSIITRSMDRQ
jgi:hypothetical protein